MSAKARQFNIRTKDQNKFADLTIALPETSFTLCNDGVRMMTDSEGGVTFIELFDPDDVVVELVFRPKTGRKRSRQELPVDDAASLESAPVEHSEHYGMSRSGCSTGAVGEQTDLPNIQLNRHALDESSMNGASEDQLEENALDSVCEGNASPGSTFEDTDAVKTTNTQSQPIGKFRETLWNARYAELLAYKREFGDTNVAKEDKLYSQLGEWVCHQRAHYKNNKLSQDRIQKLTDAGIIWQVQEANWMRVYYELKKYKREFGHVNVPHDYKANMKLARWVYSQRRMYGKGTLSEERIAKLTEVGFEWGVKSYESRWMDHYKKLLEYKRQFGDCNVPSGWQSDPTLANWVIDQRFHFKNGKLSDERIDKLNEVGFVFEQAQEANWMGIYDELKKYKREFGHVNVPHNYEANMKLGRWVYIQKYQYHKGILSEERIAKLTEVGFEWGVKSYESRWMDHYNELLEYKRQFGNCNVPSEWKSNSTLANWVIDQRCHFLNGKLSDERISKLNEAGFVFDIVKHLKCHRPDMKSSEACSGV